MAKLVKYAQYQPLENTWVLQTDKGQEVFLKHKKERPLTISQLRYQICSLITEADPDTRAKVHDIRKYAASIKLQQDMLVGDLIKDFNWSSPATF